MGCVERHPYDELFDIVLHILDVDQSRVSGYGETFIIGGVINWQEP